MFRKLRRFGQALSEESCIELLQQERRGVLSVFGEDGYPYGIPINFLYEDGKIYFHGAKEGHKIDAILENPRVSFCVFDAGVPDPKKRGLNVRSVVVFGTISFVEEPERAEDLTRRLGLKYFPDDPEYIEEETRRTANRVQILELSIDSMSGKLVNES